MSHNRMPSSVDKFQCFSWGGGSHGELGVDDAHIDREQVCSRPKPVRFSGLHRNDHIVLVTAGASSSAAIDSSGHVYTWGAGRGCRLGHGDHRSYSTPKRIEYFAERGIRIVDLSIGETHMAAIGVDRSGRIALYHWGSTLEEELPYPSPCLTVSCPDSKEHVTPKVSCGFKSTACIDCCGRLWTFGSNKHGQLGHGHRMPVGSPTLVEGVPCPVQTVSMGTVYCLAIASEERILWSWGYNGTGCLGLGDRRHRLRPTEVYLSPGVPFSGVMHCSAAVGTVSVPSGSDCIPGVDGPSSCAVMNNGDMFTWGSCHKGKLGNLSQKCLQTNWDELLPFRVGSALRDISDAPLQYLADKTVTYCASGALHTCAVTSDGEVFGFGCGSTGRLGVREFDTGLGGKRSRMKCYRFSPTYIAEFGRNLKVDHISSSRHHMIALVRVMQVEDES